MRGCAKWESRRSGFHIAHTEVFPASYPNGIMIDKLALHVFSLLEPMAGRRDGNKFTHQFKITLI